MRDRTDTLERKLHVLEQKLEPRSTFGGAELMEVETVPASRNVTMVATHSNTEANQTFVVPLRLTEPINVYRLSFVAKKSEADAVASVAFALYQGRPPALNRANPVESAFELELFRVLGSAELTDTNEKRYSITLDKELLVNPRVGYYFLGFQASGAKAKLLCPEFGFASGTMRSAWKTSSTGATTGDFARSITTQSASTYVPYAVLRSFAGVRMFGGTEDS